MGCQYGERGGYSRITFSLQKYLKCVNSQFLYNLSKSLIWNRNSPECDIRENFNTNKYPNIFISKNYLNEYISITNSTQTNVRINICIENCMNIRIFVYFLHSNTLMHECPNIFVLTNLTRTNVRIYS